MRTLRYFAEIFIDTFGITHPSEEERDRAARYIALLMLLLLVLLASVLLFALYALGVVTNH